jgi:hypothetical protein
MTKPAAQPGDRLEHMHQGGETAALPSLAGRAGERGGARAHDRLGDRRQECQGEEWQGDEERRPERAERVEHRERHDRQMPLGHQRQGREHPGAGLIERLERRAAP